MLKKTLRGSGAVYQKVRQSDKTSTLFRNRLTDSAFPDFRTEQKINNHKLEVIKLGKREFETSEVIGLICVFKNHSEVQIRNTNK